MHGAGDLVDVDAITLAELEAEGTVGEADNEAVPEEPGEPQKATA